LNLYATKAREGLAATTLWREHAALGTPGVGGENHHRVRTKFRRSFAS